jgi:hypothetical protein
MIQDVDVLAGGPGAKGRSMVVVFIPHSFGLTTWGQCYKTVYSLNLRIFVII